MDNSSNQTYSLREMAILQCSSMGGPNNTYQWQAKGTYIDGEISQILILSNVTASTGGMYTCVVSNLAGNHSASTFVFVYPYIVEEPPAIITVSTGSPVLIICDVESFPSPEYLWLRIEDRIFREGTLNNSASLNISSIQYGDEGGYYCNASARGRTVQSQLAVITGTVG
ncbi:HK97 major tail subunit [uncultured Candidatus Thioglobus sp.]|nr:HK97 major tail subunit [uncultured Candidatus Thioglobus sp.]SMN01514.1 HK97 major tail subunit [uncultured Candidatus Thioglobus sp.]